MRTPCLLAVALLAVACEKSGPSESGALTATESSLMARLPASADLVFGGNFARLQKSLQSPVFRQVMRSLDTQSPGMQKWTDCFAERDNVGVLAGLDYDKTVDVRMVMTGASVDDLEKCAKAAGFEYKLDADRKYISIQPTNRDLHFAYLVLPEAIYSRQSMKLAGGKPVAAIPDRATLEADVAAAAKANATQNAALQAALARADRSKAMWFAGTATGTPLASKVGQAFGSLDFANGIDFDLTVDLTEKGLAEKVVSGFDDAKSASGMLGAGVKDALDTVQIKRSGDTLHVVVKMSGSQLEALFAKLGPMMGGRGGPAEMDIKP